MSNSLDFFESTQICFKQVPQNISEMKEMLDQLSTEELTQFHTFRNEKRKSEWLAGRVACKTAVKRLLIQAQIPWHFSIEIESTEKSSLLKTLSEKDIILAPSTGLPPQVNTDGISVSISHSCQWACSVATLSLDEKRSVPGIGIDLEKMETPDPDIYKIVLTQSEELQVIANPRNFYLIWTAKEAVLKALGLGLSVCLTDIEVEFDGNLTPEKSHLEVFFSRNRYFVRSYFWNGYSVSLCRLVKSR